MKISCRFEISFRSKWPIWNPYRFEFHFASIHVSTSKELTVHRSEIFKRSEISYRFEFISPPKWTYSKWHVFMMTFFKYQSNYCSVIWMFHSRSLNNKINNLHERCSKIIHSYKKWNFEELFIWDNSVSYTPQKYSEILLTICTKSKVKSFNQRKLIIIIWDIHRYLLYAQCTVLIIELNLRRI